MGMTRHHRVKRLWYVWPFAAVIAVWAGMSVGAARADDPPLPEPPPATKPAPIPDPRPDPPPPPVVKKPAPRLATSVSTAPVRPTISAPTVSPPAAEPSGAAAPRATRNEKNRKQVRRARGVGVAGASVEIRKRHLGRAEEAGGLVRPPAVGTLTAVSYQVGTSGAEDVALPSAELAVMATALAVLLAAFVLTGGAVLAHQSGPLLAWAARYRLDIRLIAFTIAVATVLGALIVRFGPGGSG
jgi:hypothetical protein